MHGAKKMTIQIDSKFAMRLREERQRLRLSQCEMGAIGGVATNAQANYESGKRCPRSDYLSALCQIGVDVLYLVSGHRAGLLAEPLSANELTLLENYRVMSHLDQKSSSTALRICCT